MTSRDWNDDGVTDDDVAVLQQNEIAVYHNERSEVVIRQRCWPDDDALILVAPENAQRLCDAIMRAAKGSAASAENAEDVERSDENGAERSNRGGTDASLQSAKA